MEILESQDPEKKKLIEASERHKRALEKGMSDLGVSTQKVVTNALIVGGVLALSYLVVRSLSSSGEKPKKRKKHNKVTLVQRPVAVQDDDDDYETSAPQGILAGIGSKIASEATIFLVNMAREKLMDYLESRKKEE